MAQRSAFHKAVRTVAALQTRQPRDYYPAIDARGGGPGFLFRGLGSHEEESKRGEWEFTAHFAKRRTFARETTGMRQEDSYEDSKGSSAAILGSVYRDLDRAMPPFAMSGNSSSALTAESGYFARFSGTQTGHVASRIRAGILLPRVVQGPSNRSFSSVPFRAEGAQIAVDRELLDSSQGGLSGVSDSESVTASLPISDSLSEVAAAAADCSYPTAFIQYVIDGVHVSTGLPWWLSIVATTLAIRVLVLPVMVYQMKSTARLTLLRPELEKLTNHIKESGYDPKVVEDNQIRMKALFMKHKTSPFSPILGAFIQAPLFMCFFFAIRNMAEKMESFKEGGALWFTDLSTPDSLFILPVLSGAFFLLTVELGATDGMQGQPMLAKMKMFMRGLSVLLVPLTASFPKALFCYWLTANVCSIIQAVVFKQPGVKDILGIPDVSHLAKPADLPVPPVVTFSQHPPIRGVARSKRQKQR